jgi:DtxR family Mn-dependent transcriptional regulator
MTIDPMMEEVLEALWIATEEEGLQKVTSERLGLGSRHMLLAEMARQGLLSPDGEAWRPTEAGREEARQAVRRHRLAERLVTDVFSLASDRMEEAACAFEHLVRREVEESICTLLGHPAFCPHGKAIPPGECCREGKTSARSVVVPLSELKKGEKGTVAYLQAGEEDETIPKLLALGILPGCKVELLQRFPSYLFRIGHTQVAVDETIAGSVRIRIGA